MPDLFLVKLETLESRVDELAVIIDALWRAVTHLAKNKTDGEATQVVLGNVDSQVEELRTEVNKMDFTVDQMYSGWLTLRRQYPLRRSNLEETGQNPMNCSNMEETGLFFIVRDAGEKPKWDRRYDKRNHH